VPTLVIIKNGTVVEKLEGDIGYEQWAKRLTKGCGVRPRWVSVDISKRQSRILAPSSSLAAAKDSISEEEYAATSQPETQAAAPTLPSDASVNDAANEGAPATYEDTTAQQIPAPPSAVLDNITASAAPIDTTSTLEPQTASAEPSTVAANETTTEGASTAPAETAPTHNPEQLQAILSERGQRLEAERLRREATEKAERIARARARREEEERAQAEAQQQSDKGKSRADGSEYARNKARVDWVQQQAKRKQEAKDEKELIARFEDRLLKDPLPLPPQVDPNAIKDFDYRRVLARGVLRHDQEMLIGPRVHDGQPGFQVVTPLDRSEEFPGFKGNTTVLINRG
jgi:chemotaxis protein histidine kinase CheA